MSAGGKAVSKDVAVAHLRAGRLDDAEAALRSVLAEAPEHAEAHFHLATVLARSERLEDSLTHLREAARLAPDNAAVWRNLGVCLAQLERYDESLVVLERVLELDPSDPARRFDIAAVHFERGDPDAAEPWLRQVLQAAPAHPGATIALARVLIGQERFRDALPHLLEALEREPDNLALLLDLGRAHRGCGELEAAATAYERALGIDCESVGALTGLALTRTAQGRLDDARKCYHDALALNPDDGAVLGNLAQIRRFAPEDRALIERMIRVAGRTNLEAGTRVQLEFSIGKALDDIEDYDAAFEHFLGANRLAAQSAAFDAEGFGALIDRIIETFDAAYFRERSDSGVESDLPVFVVGMGRSGTSLVEQILASHGQVHGAGEVNYVEGLSLSLAAQAAPGADAGRPVFPEAVCLLGREDAPGFGRAYLDRLRAHGPEATRIVDKMPLNFQYLGFIATILTGARVVHCRRHPLDTCLSLFFHHFSDPQPYAYDLECVGRYYRGYERLMAHWRTVLPMAMLELDYEALVENQERESRRLVEFCGLPWDARCLAFHESDRAVQTASRWQVRQPIYRRSVGRWRHYEAHLAPLERALGLRERPARDRQR